MALTETAAYITEFAGDYKVALFLINPGAVSGTVTVAEFSSIIGVVAQLAEDSTVNCKGYSTSVSSNIVTCKAIKGDGTAGTTAQLDFYLAVIGK